MPVEEVEVLGAFHLVEVADCSSLAAVLHRIKPGVAVVVEISLRQAAHRALEVVDVVQRFDSSLVKLY